MTGGGGRVRVRWRTHPAGGGDSGSSTAGMVASGVAGLVFLALTLLIAVPMLFGTVRVRGARVYVYEHGAIAERPGGDGRDPKDREVLPEIARALRADEHPEPLGRLHTARAPTLF